MEQHNRQLEILVRKQEAQDNLREKQKREETARFLLKSLKGGSSWYCIENLKLLFMYRDFDFVKSAVEELYQNSSDEEIKSVSANFLNGTLNIDNLLLQQKRFKQVQLEAKKIRDYLFKSFSKTEVNDHLNLYNLKKSQNLRESTGITH
jgi:hypothetical protein